MIYLLQHPIVAALLATLLLAGCAAPKPGPSPAPAPAPAPASARNQILIDGEPYLLPIGVEPERVRWVAGPNRIVWEEGYQIRLTPRQAGGGDLQAGVTDLIRLRASGEDPGATVRIGEMMLSGGWLVYTTEEWHHEAPAGRYQVRAVNLDKPEGNILLASIVREGQATRLQVAASEGFAVWQWATPSGPEQRYTRGETRAFHLDTGKEWALPDVGWADSLRIEQGILRVRAGGKEFLLGLSRPEGKPGETVTVLSGELDGEPEADTVYGTLNPGGGRYTELWVMLGGKRRVDLPAEGRAYSVRLAPLGAPFPVLLVEYPMGSMGNEYRAFAIRNGKAERLNWGWSEQRMIGSLTLDPATKTAIVGHRMMDYVRHQEFEAYTYREGRLEPADTWVGPGPDALTYPSDPTFVLLAALTSISLDLPAETPRYFAAPAEGARTHAELSSRLPRGATWALPDGIGVEAGEDRPFRVVATTSAGTLPFSGTVSVSQRGNQFVIEKLILNR